MRYTCAVAMMKIYQREACKKENNFGATGHAATLAMVDSGKATYCAREFEAKGLYVGVGRDVEDFGSEY